MWPPPNRCFGCDDILQTFDDDRAMAAMQALVLLSERVQVIFLSHHRHLAGLSARLAPESDSLVRDIGWGGCI